MCQDLWFRVVGNTSWARKHNIQLKTSLVFQFIMLFLKNSVYLWIDEGESDSHISSSSRAITHKQLFCLDCSFVCFHSESWETSGSWSVFMTLNSLAILVRCLLRAFTSLIKMLTVGERLCFHQGQLWINALPLLTALHKNMMDKQTCKL